MSILLFSVGAALGAPLRFWLDNFFRPKYKFPIGIFLANLVGSFLIGLIAKETLTNSEFLLLGFCGALTTWSTFIVDIYLNVKNRDFKDSFSNFFISIILGFIAFLLGNSIM
jgi:CrcB protein